MAGLVKVSLKLKVFVSSGSRGREKGEFTNLQGISASSNGRVVVADSNNQCIQVRLTTDDD